MTIQDDKALLLQILQIPLPLLSTTCAWAKHPRQPGRLHYEFSQDMRRRVYMGCLVKDNTVCIDKLSCVRLQNSTDTQRADLNAAFVKTALSSGSFYTHALLSRYISSALLA